MKNKFETIFKKEQDKLPDPFIRDVTLWAAFMGGVVSFISPCILPIIPSYMLFISGTSAGSLIEPKQARVFQTHTILNALCFIMGFSLVFIAFGAAASSIGQALKSQQTLLRQIGGMIVILFGLHMMGLFEFKSLLYEKRLHFKARPPGYMGAFLIGIAFAAGWTPCIGPILGAILAIASTKTAVSSGVLLLSFYSLGLGIPFFLTALLMDKLFIHFKKIQHHMKAITLGSGMFLIAIGILIFTNSFQAITNFFLMLG